MIFADHVRVIFGPRLRASLFVLGAICASALLFAVLMQFIADFAESFLRKGRPPSFVEATAAVPMEYALSTTERNDVVFVGDSTLVCGVDTLEFQRLTGLRAYNLGSLGTLSIDGIVTTTKAYLSKHPTPRVIVLSLMPNGLQYAQVESPIAQRFVRTYGRQLGIANHDAHDTELALIKRGAGVARDYCNAMMNRAFESWRDEPLVDDSRGYTFNTFQRKRSEGRGYESPRGEHSFDHLIHQETNPITGLVPVNPTPLLIQPEWDAGVRRLAHLADQSNSRLLVRLAPAPTIIDRRIFVDIVSWLQSLERDFPHAVIKTDIVGLDFSLFWDWVHLNAEGAQKFTRLVAEDVLAVLHEGRRPTDSREKSHAGPAARVPKSSARTSRPSGPNFTRPLRLNRETLSAEAHSKP